MELAERVESWLRDTNIAPSQANPVLESVGSAPIREPTRLATLVRRPDVSVAALAAATAGAPEGDPDAVAEALAAAEMELRYAGYLDRERERAGAVRRQGDMPLPDDLPYAELQALSFEARQKLDRIRPATLGQAARVPGVSPADLQNLLVAVRRRSRAPQTV